MARPSRAERGPEKFVQWKEPVEAEGDTSNFDGPDSNRAVRKNKPTRRQKSLLASMAASVEGARVEEAEHATSPNVRVTDTIIGTSSQSLAVLQSSPPPPRFKPPCQMQNTRSSSQLQRSHASVVEVHNSADRVPGRHQRAAGPHESVQQQGDVEEHEEDDISGPPPRKEQQGERDDYVG